MDWTFKEIVNTEEELRAVMGHPSERVTRKTIDYLDHNCLGFIEQSPFVIVGSSDSEGNFDLSPKGDPPGFVKALNNQTLAIPDRLGNRRADTFVNIIQNPKVGLIFLIPGIKETLRVSGRAQLVTDRKVLELLAHKEKLPNFALIVKVEEAFMHCAKCVIRSSLWTSEQDTDRVVPGLAESMVDAGDLDITYEEMDDLIKKDEETRLY